MQTCEDIVHVDALSPNPPSANSLHPRRSTNKPKKACANSTNQITEVYASTRPYPTWWSDIQETKILRRRKSMGDTVLERNLCFVDTPGYSSGIPRIESIELVLQYIEEQFTKSFCAANGSEGDLVGLLSGSGGFQVDVVFYLIAQGTFIKFFLVVSANHSSRYQERGHCLPPTSDSPHQHHPSNC